MTKFGQAEYINFMARIFADKLDKILEENEKQNFNIRNAEDIYRKFPSSKDAVQGDKMLGFILGAVFGGTAGVFAICMCKAASDADKCMNQTDSED